MPSRRAPERSSPPPSSPVPLSLLHARINQWYADEGRKHLPWREPDCSPWGVFLSEVMSQQTPLARVEPIWREWMARWPTPGDLAAAAPGEAVRAWGRLGYPRRALRLHEAATVMIERHDGQVPATPEELLALPGVGAYTAAAVSCFAFGLPEVVVDTNVRRVLARTLEGKAFPHLTLNRAEARLAADSMPADVDDANTWNVAVMELGALVCVARGPKCEECPVAGLCAWNLDGRPAYDGPPRRGQAWHGTDRQVRGELLHRLRAAHAAVSLARLEDAADDRTQVMRCLDSLVADGLVEPLPRRRFRLPA
ncbi:A/G-specific adenine glycosylase [Terrabacter sp. BE26]|uniref:A/G-specific adenine glycosylase n=1 Tax=Terrabacter sp. BE26 TaxID=2898152 RepID=UPI0035BE249F